MRNLSLLLATIPGIVLIANPAIAEVKSSQSGQISAELSYTRGQNSILKITRQGQTYNYDIPYKELGNPVYVGNEKGLNKTGLLIIDLDKSGEPEIIVDFRTGGAHCCEISLIGRFQNNQYIFLKHYWGNGGAYYVLDYNQNNNLTFYSRDDRFAYQFAAYAGSCYPPQIWQYQQGQLIDVTREYPKSIQENADRFWNIAQNDKANLALEKIKAPLAAYLADQYLLGQGALGWQKVRSIYTFDDRDDFFNNLQQFLTKTGYTN